MLKRKIDDFLINWKNNPLKKPLIVTGAKEVGKTTSIIKFSKSYQAFIYINFKKEPQYKKIFLNSNDVDTIIEKILLINPKANFIKNNTLIFFDEIDCLTDVINSLKLFSLDNRYDVIAARTLLKTNYQNLDCFYEYHMFSLDFEEFLWAKGYDDSFINELFDYMKKLEPLPMIYMKILTELFRDYLFVGGMPEAVAMFVKTNKFNEVFNIQKKIAKHYEKYLEEKTRGLKRMRIMDIYKNIHQELFKENHKFQITQIKDGARINQYLGIKEWLKDVGIINIAYNLETLELPLSSYERKNYYRIYYGDHSLFVSKLDKESREAVILNNNYEIYNGALYESLVSEALVKQGYDLYFYKSTDATIELDFIIRVKNEIIPIEVKRNRGRSKSLNRIIETNAKINYGVKLTSGNIGFSENKFTFPYFLTFLLKRFFNETNYIKW